MTERELLKIAEVKLEKCSRQRYKCGVCGKPIRADNCELAHRIPQSSLYLRMFGKGVIHHPMNMVAVCLRSDKCNSSVSLRGDGEAVYALAAEIISAIDKDQEG